MKKMKLKDHFVFWGSKLVYLFIFIVFPILMLGWLNFQVEHHLFPSISHVHYPEISKIVKRVCEEFHIKHLEFSNIFKAIGSHLRYLKMVGAHP